MRPRQPHRKFRSSSPLKYSDPDILRTALAGTLSSSAYTLLTIWAALRYKRERAQVIDCTDAVEPLSVLKPVHGERAAIEANLLTFFRQDHPDFEPLFSARHLEDPALTVAGG